MEQSQNPQEIALKKNLFSPIIWQLGKAIRPFFTLSLVLHALILLIPLPQLENKEPESTPEPISQEEVVKVTQIPPSPQPKPPTVEPQPTKTPTPTPSPSVPQTSPEPKAIVPPQPETPQPEPEATKEPEPIILPQEPEPAEQEEEEEPILPTSPFAAVNFPTYQGANSGCFSSNTCNEVSGIQGFRSLSNNLQAYLEQNDYTVVSQDDLRDTGVEIFQVSKEGETQYLSVLDTGIAGKAIYILASTPITSLKKLQQLEQSRLQLISLLQAIPSSEEVSEPSYFQQPELFFTDSKLRAEIGANLLLIKGISSEFLFENIIQSSLTAQGFESTAIEDYGTGKMYTIKHNNLIIGYLNLVPTPNDLETEKQGTMIIFWQNKPD